MADDVAAQEFFGDFIALDGHHFSVPVARPACLLQPLNWDVASCSEGVDRMTEALAALALSLRRRFTIRCARNGRRSPQCVPAHAHWRAMGTCRTRGAKQNPEGTGVAFTSALRHQK